MLSPAQLHRELPASPRAVETVARTRDALRNILDGCDPRVVVIVGPCSIHDVDAARAYANRLRHLAEAHAHQCLVLMRTYFEKPRTTLGWRGLLTDPHLDGSADIETGLRLARRLLLDLNEMGVPCATESLDPLLVDHTVDLVSWTALGARTAESQIHRAMASGLPLPVGIKNGTDGRWSTAVDAIATARGEQHYMGVDAEGRIAVRQSPGNPDGHVVLRGGTGGPNHDEGNVTRCSASLAERGLPQRVVIDCSHANSGKDPTRQPEVLAQVGRQIAAGGPIAGVMLESHLETGSQPLPTDRSDLAYGVSITDGCLGWNDTASALRAFARQVAASVEQRRDERPCTRQVA